MRWLSAIFPGQNSKPLGQRGEDLAARHLRSLGYKIIRRNFVTPLGEIDIIAREGGTLVFVEVKTRAQDEPTPEDQVNRHKQHQLTRVGKLYLGKYKTPPPARFDVVAIIWPEGFKPTVRHIPHAFEATF